MIRFSMMLNLCSSSHFQGLPQLSLCLLSSIGFFNDSFIKINLCKMHLPEKKIQLCPFEVPKTSIPAHANFMSCNPKSLPDLTAWTSLNIADLSLPLLHSRFETCSFMRKIKDLCCEPHWMPCGFVYDFYSTDRQSSFPFKEDVKPNFCL